jgi:lipopolysaccharide/colanic/teichoic acid biosynthesis glycosyltransferase
MLLIISPVILGVAIAIKLESPGPVFYSQMRVGKWGETFTLYKLRSMYIDADQRKQELTDQNEADGPIFKMKQDPRITRVGRIIRKLSIDELPQLYNVLRGDMSMVGPRPAVPQEVAQYQFEERNRLEVTPGITGLQQISGRSDLDFKRWVELDFQYIAEQGLRTDIMIMLKTIPAVISGKGAY